jgi:hypothetical protein
VGIVVFSNTGGGRLYWRLGGGESRHTQALEVSKRAVAAATLNGREMVVVDDADDVIVVTSVFIVRDVG